MKELGADVEATDANGQTALQISTAEGHRVVVRVLIKELGAKEEAKDKDSRTPLHLRGGKIAMAAPPSISDPLSEPLSESSQRFPFSTR